MTTKDIRTAHVQISCDVCGRTLLRGEKAQTYLAGGSRRQVCELCSPRAAQEGWVREGVALERATRSFGGERRRSLFGRLLRGGTGGRGRREAAIPAPGAGAGAHVPAPDNGHVGWQGAVEDREPLPAPEPRQVRAVPTSPEQRVVSAIERFNRSEHPRTVAGVARSLGAPVAVVRPAAEHGSLVTIVVSWELCWYRYEVELSDDGAGVRLAAQGYELSEVAPEDCAEGNAAADEYGLLSPV